MRMSFKMLYLIPSHNLCKIDEELCVSNIAEFLLTSPYFERQRYILESRKFICQCERCLYKWDDTRRIDCNFCDSFLLFNANVLVNELSFSYIFFIR